MSTSTKALSASYVSVRYGVTETTGRLFIHKLRESMKSSESQPMDEEVHIDEFFVGERKMINQGEVTILRRKRLFVHFN